MLDPNISAGPMQWIVWEINCIFDRQKIALAIFYVANNQGNIYVKIIVYCFLLKNIDYDIVELQFRNSNTRKKC